MRVALITETFLPGVNGVTTTLCRLLDYLQAEGHESLVFAPLGAPKTYAGAEIVPLGGVPLPFYPEINFTPPQFGITAQLRRFQPHVVHLVAPAILGAIVPDIVRNLSIPLLSSYHTDLIAYSDHYGLGFLKDPFNAYLRWIHNRSRITLCPSVATLNKLRSQGFRRLKVWGRGVDTVRFQPHHRSFAWREAIGVQPGETVVIYVGRISKEKRIDLLEEAMQGLDSVRLVLVGDGPARAEFQQRMKGLPVHFTGYLQGDDLSTAYASADVFVFPSDTDTFGQVMQEGMASGLPVVAARSGGAPDLVREEVTGLLFAPGNAADLHNQLRRLIAEPHTRASMGQLGRQYAERRSWRSVMEELMGHYGHLLRRTPWSRQVGWVA
jgi:glycosyltransferase involved in cell wall biosynthesis